MKKMIDLVKRKPWLSILCVIYLAAMIAVSIPKSMELTNDSDQWNIWQAGKDFYSGDDIYERGEERPYYYPPFSGFVFQPLYMMSLQHSGIFIFLLNALLLLPFSIFLIYRILLNIGVKPKRAEQVLILSTLFTLKYFWNNLVMYQVNYIILLVILAGIYYLSTKKYNIAGILFTIITFIKVIPVFLAAYVFIFHFSRKVVISMVLTTVLILSVPISMRGLERYKQDHVGFYEVLLKQYILDGRIVADQVNHSLKAGFIKTFYPETRTDENVNPDDYPGFVTVMNIITLVMLLTLVVNGYLLFRRKRNFSLAYLSSIILFTHLFSGITWTAHLVTFIFCLLPVLLIERQNLRRTGKIAWWAFIVLMVFLGIEGSDTVGEKIYLAIRIYDVYTYLLLGLFIFCSWVVMGKRSASIYPEGILI